MALRSAVNFGAVSALLHFDCASHGENMFAIAIHGGAGTLSRRDTSAEQEQAYRAGLSEALDAGYAMLERGGFQPRCRHRGSMCPGGQPAVQCRTRRGAHARRCRGVRRLGHGWQDTEGRRRDGAQTREEPDRARAPGHGPLTARHAGGRRRGRIRAAPGRGTGLQRVLPYAGPAGAAASPACRVRREGKRPRRIRHGRRRGARRSTAMLRRPRRPAA